ncbi:MAG: lytic transglycosylase domain-containing protein [Sphingorhabdus sp.]|uniref:lytic transglycosylase domain-containing protein n=1 Tax=Sphingorhabdus sp. TaxID=1902408 RepID=UPI003CBFD4C7
MRLHLTIVGIAILLAGEPALAQKELPPAQSARVDIAAHVAEASQRFSIPEGWIYAVMRVESGGKIGAVSPAGAMGLMQLMPGTWARQRARFSLGSDPFNPRDNIIAGTSYLREMYDRYGADGFLAAYNAGPGRYEDYARRGRPLPAETVNYVALIAPRLQSGGTVMATSAEPALQASAPSVVIPWTQASLFVTRSGVPASETIAMADPSPGSPSRAQNSDASDLFAPVSARNRQ